MFTDISCRDVQNFIYGTAFGVCATVAAQTRDPITIAMTSVACTAFAVIGSKTCGYVKDYMDYRKDEEERKTKKEPIKYYRALNRFQGDSEGQAMMLREQMRQAHVNKSCVTETTK